MTIAFIVAAAAISCGDDDDDEPTTVSDTPDDANTTTIEQSTVGNLGPYRIGVIRVDVENKSASVSILRSDGHKLEDASLKVGRPHQLPDGALHLLETRDGGSNRDTIRIRFEPAY